MPLKSSQAAEAAKRSLELEANHKGTTRKAKDPHRESRDELLKKVLDKLCVDY